MIFWHILIILVYRTWAAILDLGRWYTFGIDIESTDFNNVESADFNDVERADFYEVERVDFINI
jgi:hypothetical protein